jgi:hypothetical protein
MSTATKRGRYQLRRGVWYQAPRHRLGGLKTGCSSGCLPTHPRKAPLGPRPGDGGAFRLAPRPLVLDLSDQFATHLREGMIKVALVGGGHEVSPSR